MASPLTADPTAVFGRRVVAAVIDGAVIIAPGIAIATSQMEYLTRERVGGSFDDFCDTYMEQQGGACVQLGDRVYFDDGAGPGPLLVGLVIGLLLLVLLQGLTGRTIGKALTGLRTVKEDGSVPGIGRALVRWLLWVVDGQPCGLPLVGFITGLTTQGHRRVGDMAAKTFVVRRSAAGAPIVVPGMTAPPPQPLGGPPGSWGAAPSASAAPTPMPASAGPGAPQWDAARGTYIQWDPALARWMQWDEAAHSWSPIPGQ